MKQKKAAIELSIGTLVIIIIGMTMLILGIVLVTNIFEGGIGLADVSNQQARTQIVALFSEEDSNIVIQAGADRLIEVEAGGDERNVNLGARKQISAILQSRGDLKYTLAYQTKQQAPGNCDSLGVNVDNFFIVSLGVNGAEGNKIDFDRFESDTAFATIELAVPKGTPSCTQKIFITVYDNTNQAQGSEFFTIRAKQGGIFGN